MIYLDSMASTPLAPEVSSLMHQLLNDPQLIANPSSNHTLGRYSAEWIQKATEQCRNLIQAEEGSIIWTSGATESINLAIKGAMNFYRQQGTHLITTATEHPATINVAKHLKKNGFRVTFLQPNHLGHYHLDQFKKACHNDTVMISIHHANNELGTIHNIKKLANYCHEQGILLHVDAAQTVGKIEINLQETPIDLMSMSAHKFYGPKGVGTLYCRQKIKRVRLCPEIIGGMNPQIRAGTQSPMLIAAMGEACSRAQKMQHLDSQYCKQLRDSLFNELIQLEGIHPNGCMHTRLPNNLNVRVDGIANHELLQACAKLCFSSNSACVGSYKKPSHVLTSIGLTTEQANQSVRFGLHPFLKPSDIELASKILKQAIISLRSSKGVLA
jgi:cysteine desulfurase